MNNVLKDSLFVSQNRKFDEIQSVVRQFSAEYVGNSIIKDNIFAVIQNYARKKEIALELLRFPIHDDELWALTFLKQLMMEKPACSEILSRMACMTDHALNYRWRAFSR